MIDPREISAMASQIVGPQAAPAQPQPQMMAPAPKPEDLMAMLGGMGGAPPGMPMPPGMGPPPEGMMPPGGGEQPPTKPAPDLVPPGLKEEIAKYAATQQVQMSKQLLALAGPESSDVPAGRGLLLDLWHKRKENATDEQIQTWKAEGKKPAWILANSFPGRYALMAMGHWKPSEKAEFARRMQKLSQGQTQTVPPSGQSYDPDSLEAVANEDPTPSIDL